MGFFQTVGDGFKVMGEEAKQKVADNRANIFTGVSVFGTIATAIVSAFGGAKSARQIDAKALELQRPLTTKEKAKLCWKNFLVPAGTVIGSSASAITSRVIDSGDIARLTTDVAVVTKAYNEFKKASNEVLTEKQQMEVKDKIAEEKRERIRPGDFDKAPCAINVELPQLFVDGFDPNVKFINTMDGVCRAIAEMQAEMAQCKPRNRYGYSPVESGVKYTSWLKKIGFETSLGCGRGGVIYEHYGWNKGFDNPESEQTDTDDDVISCYFSPGETEYQGQKRSCYVIIWDQEPSDMRLGNLIKSGQV